MNKVAQKIATKWKDVATQLGYSKADNFAPCVNLIEERFRQMLQFWLKSNKAKTLDEIFEKFRTALINIDLNVAAKEFEIKTKEYQSKNSKV